MNKYFEFTSTEKSYLNNINDNYNSSLSKYACKNSDAIRINNRIRYSIIRLSFAYDVDKIIHNPIYNRYADKTQVFSFYKNDDITRRALHVQFVSKIARTIGRALNLNLDLIEAISLGHDMGHTPFGHKGEEFLSECYQESCIIENKLKRYFNHNVHSTKIFRYIIDGNLTVQTLSGILSHNGEKVCKEYAPSKLNNFKDFDNILENCYTDNEFHKTLHPNTLEGCVVRISDMIAYAGKDRQDLYRAKLITNNKFTEKRLIGNNNSDIISNLIINIIKNSIDSPSLSMDKEVFDDLKDLINENYNVIYGNEQLNAPYYDIVKPLMHKLYFVLIDDIKQRKFESPVFQHYLNDPILGNFYRDNDSRAIIAEPNEIVTDFIASMTDDYFIDICKYMHIDDNIINKISYHEYF